MDINVNSINASIFTFEYESKQLASSCNERIETIFKAQIASDLEAVIKNNIPNDITVLLDTIEIDIGTLREDELERELAKRIRKAFENELGHHLRTKQGGGLITDIHDNGNPAHVLIKALDLFLVKGYFPKWLDSELSLNKLFEELINRSKSNFISLVRKYKENEPALWRISLGLKPNNFHSLIAAIAPENEKWIFDFKKQLIQLIDVDSNQIINFLILKLLLNQTDNFFDKIEFRDEIVEAYLTEYRLDSTTLLKTLETKKVKSSMDRFISEKLIRLQEVEKRKTGPDEDQSSELQELISLINKETNEFHKHFSKEKFIDLLKRGPSRQLLLKTLEYDGLMNIFTFFFKYEGKKLLSIISSFAKMTKHVKDDTKFTISATSLNELAITTLLIFDNQSDKKVDFEKYFVLLTSFIGIKKSFIKQNNKMRGFIEEQKDLDIFKIDKLLEDSNSFKEIRKTKVALEKIIKESDSTSNNSFTSSKQYYHSIDKIRGRIIQHYLAQGYLPKQYKDLSFIDVRYIFQDFLKTKDPILAYSIGASSISADPLIERFQRLLTDENKHALDLYINHFFEETHRFAIKTIAEFTTAIKIENFSTIDLKLFSNTIQLKSLIHSKGKYDPLSILDWIHKSFSEYLPTEVLRSKNYTSFFITRKALVEPTLAVIDIENKSEIINSTNKELLHYKLAIMQFYALNEFLPWWSEERSLIKFFKDFEADKETYESVLNEVFWEIEREEPFMDKMATVLPFELIQTLTTIFSSNEMLSSSWKEIVAEQKKNGVSTNVAPTKKKPQKELLIEALDLNSSQDIDLNLVKKSLYFLNEKDLLDTIVFKKNSLKGQMDIYLKLAPYFYFQNLTPQLWRQYLFTFAINYWAKPQSNQKANFHISLLTFLKRKYHQTSWDEVLLAVYQKSQFSSTIHKNDFPKELLTIIEKTHLRQQLKNKKEMEIPNPIMENNVGDEIQINNAGIIIVWPFLTRLFEQLQMVENGAFKDPSKQCRAIYLLQYLAFDQIQFPEYELVLNKLLVGMPFQDHIEPIERLSKEEENMAASLMNGLIQNWEKVKNSSVEGIQETFIRREGVLIIGKENNKLTIPKKGVDVLVESIPWNLSLIKLPWMEKPLHIEWI